MSFLGHCCTEPFVVRTDCSHLFCATLIFWHWNFTLFLLGHMWALQLKVTLKLYLIELWFNFSGKITALSGFLFIGTHCHRGTGPVSFRGAEVSCPNIFSIACPKIKWFCPNITWFFARIWLFEKFQGGGGGCSPPAFVRLCALYNVSNDYSNIDELLKCLTTIMVSCGHFLRP